MYKIGICCALVLMLACSSNDEGGTDTEGWINNIQLVSRPFELRDTALLNRKLTDTISSSAVAAYIPDSLKQEVFGNRRIRYYPVSRVESGTKDVQFVVVSAEANRRAAYLLAINTVTNVGTAMTFLVPDQDRATQQFSSIDSRGSISKHIEKQVAGSIADGREVYTYDASSNQFHLAAVELLDDTTVDVINPIDTLPQTHKYAGNYQKNTRNFVTIRDGRAENQFNFFIHFENQNGDCTGELKGEAIMTSDRTAVFRSVGDPCVLEFQFTATSVRIGEKDCGTHRGVRCFFEGSFPKKKQTTSSGNR